ncbi:hypothetical protein F3J34_11365 [Klebsiella sp. Ap-873]|nr:hypothetical protein [Klebsiella sp. Ap-873]
MNYLDRIKNSMKPQLHEVVINGVTFWVHRPSMQDFPKCDTVANTLVLCVKDENGDPIFADKDIDGRVNVNSMDFSFAQELYQEVVKLLDTNSVDEVEKK